MHSTPMQGSATDMEKSKRTIVREILVSQLAYALAVGLIAIGCVWWVSNWVVRDNLEDWAVRWVGEMESLGAGFFVNPADERFLELQTYLSRFDEIEYVRYYGLDGRVIYVESAAGEPRLYPELDAGTFAALEKASAEGAAGGPRYRMDVDRDPLVRISQAVTRESIVSANLFSAETLSELEGATTVVGFVELGLDYSGYDRDLMTGISTGSGFVMLAFLTLMLAGRLAIRQAVQPLADMQQPLESIARGNLDVKIPTSRYREISAIGEALETALDSIRERDRHLLKLANFDPLTGLATRHHFIEQLTARLAGATPGYGALLFVDMDQFKHVNDTYGHQAGDQALVQVGARLRQHVRRDDLLGRFGGDEFVLFIPDISASDADAMADKLLREMGEFPLVYDDVSLSANCSLGIAMVEETSRLNPEELISQADVACRLAKSTGRNRACRYQPDEKHIETIKSDVEWQGKLKRALKEDLFELHYQPIQNLADGVIRHYEVLVRLREGEMVYLPDQFLPAAVRFGLMRDIDHWVLEHAFAELAALRRTTPNVRFAINLGGSAFIDTTLASFVLGRLKAHGVPPDAAIFEITEQVAVGSFSEAVPQIRELRAAGCEFAVDDFGTGYSSLSYLKRLPVQYIKIDGSFVRRLSVSKVDQTIVRAIADIARIMGKETIAEFVGDTATLEVIREIGIDYAQGYLIGEPRRVPQANPEQERVVPIDRARRVR